MCYKMYHFWANDPTHEICEWTCCADVHPKTDVPGAENWREVTDRGEQDRLRRSYAHVVNFREIFACEGSTATAPVNTRTVHQAPFPERTDQPQPVQARAYAAG